jgi:hypothetical protein
LKMPPWSSHRAVLRCWCGGGAVLRRWSSVWPAWARLYWCSAPAVFLCLGSALVLQLRCVGGADLPLPWSSHRVVVFVGSPELWGELRHDNTARPVFALPRSSLALAVSLIPAPGCSSLLARFLCVGVVLPCKLGSALCILFAVDGVINLTLGRLAFYLKKKSSANHAEGMCSQKTGL